MPLNMPSTPKFRSSSFGLSYNTDVFTSPFTRQQQVLERTGAQWRGTFTLPPMNRALAASWIAFLVACKGQAATFYAGDPDAAAARGVATGTPLVKGASQTGGSLLTDGWTTSTTGILKAGDYFTVNGELKLVLADVNSDSGGNATITFAPTLRVSPSDNASITVSAAAATMRLVDDGQATWSADENGIFNITFSGVEVIT